MTIRAGPANHIEMVHRWDEGDLAVKLLTLLGLEVVTLPAAVAGITFRMSRDKTLFLSPVTPEQWAFEQWLADRLLHDATAQSRAFIDGQSAWPQKFPHFGVGFATLGDWERTVERLCAAEADDPDLKGRIAVPMVKRPPDEGSVAHATGGQAGRTLYQAFLRTDLFSSGLLTLGQAIDVQHYRENDPAFAGED